MKVQAGQKEGYALLVVPEDVTFQNCQELRQQFDRALAVFPEAWFVLDFSMVGFINSSGIGVLVEVLRALRARGGGLFLVSVSEPIRRLFEKTRLHEDILLLADEGQVRRYLRAAGVLAAGGAEAEPGAGTGTGPTGAPASSGV